MDISNTIQPQSDQLDAVELIAPRTFVIESVSKGNADQPVNIHLIDFPRAWRPGKSMRRVLVACWGPDASVYVGRSVRLFCDPDVVFGGLAVGGTRIAALSHIDKPKKIPLLVARGKSAIFTVQPLPDAPAPAQKAPAPTLEELMDAAEKATSEDELNRVARQAVAANLGADLDAVKAVVTARREDIRGLAE